MAFVLFCNWIVTSFAVRLMNSPSTVFPSVFIQGLALAQGQAIKNTATSDFMEMKDSVSLRLLTRLQFAARARAYREDHRDAGSGVGGAVLVVEVGFVAAGHETLVVDEEYDHRHRNHAVFFVGGGGGVVEFESALEAAIEWGRVGVEGRLENAIELASAGNILRALANFEGFFENFFDRAAGFG